MEPKQGGQELDVENFPFAYWVSEQISLCSSPEQSAVVRGKSILSFVKASGALLSQSPHYTGRYPGTVSGTLINVYY